MELVYRSTRNAQETATASMAILKGLANEGGLFVPDTIPAFDKSLEELSKMDYREVAYQVMKLMLTDFIVSTVHMIRSSIQRRLHRSYIRQVRIIWNCSMAQQSRLRIWHFPFFHIC